MLSRSSALLLAPLVLVAVAAAPGQTPTAGVTTELVRLDAVVTDANGKPVFNLAREDFEVLEDAKPQRVTNFTLVGRTRVTTPTEPASPDATTPEAREEADPGPTRYVVIVVDDLHLGRDAVEPAKQVLRRFVAEQVAPEDQLGLVMTSTPLGLQTLTQDRAAIRQAIGRVSSRDAGGPATANGSQMTPAEAELILRGDQSALRLATRLLMDEPASVLGAQSPRAAIEAADGSTPAGLEPAEKAAARQAQREASSVLGGALRFSEITLRTVDGVLSGLAPLRGRKLCLVVSDGFLVGRGTSEERTKALRQVTDAATRSGAVAYALDVRGLVQAGADAGVGGPVSDPGLRERVARLAREESRETLQRLAEDTGGLLLDGTESGVGLNRMLADNDAFYLIAYEPTNTKRDGRFRKIELRVPRRLGLVVRTRAGYFAPDGRKPDVKAALRANPGLPSLLAGQPGLDETTVRAALEAPFPTTGRVRMTADYLDLPPEGSQTIVQARVDVAGLPRQQADGQRRTAVQVLGGVYDASGKPVGLPFGRSFDLDPGSADYRRATEEGLRYAHRLALSPGRYEVRVVARDPALAPLGGAVQWVEIPDLSANKLTLSSLFVSSSQRKKAGAAPGAGEGAETLREAQVLRRFKQSDSLYFQVYVYNILPDEKGVTDVVLQAQIRSGPKPIAASKLQPVRFQAKEGFPIPESNGMSLESLAPGNYELRVVVVDRKANATASRSVDITVE